MAITYGFFNSKNHDRVYEAEEFNRIFEAIITDGVFSEFGDVFAIEPSGSGMTCWVKSGKAWFNKSWILNDSIYPIAPEVGSALLNRIDAIVIEINKSESVRTNSIKVVKGTEHSTPTKPILIKDDENGIWQYALAYVTIDAGATELTDDMIESVIGSEETPYISGVVDQLDIENLLGNWEGSFTNHFEAWCNEQYDSFYTDFMSKVVNELNTTQIGQIQSAIAAKPDGPIVKKMTLYAAETNINVYFGRDVDFDTYDYTVDVYSNIDNTILVSTSTSTNYMDLYFKPLNRNAEIVVAVRKL